MNTNPDNQFETIVDEHYEPLFRFAMSLTRSEFDARDLTQQTFYIWATKGHQLRDRSKIKTWLYTTMHRAFISLRRKESRFLHYNLEDVAEELPAIFPAGINQSDASQVLAALSRVDEIYQAAVALFYLENYSYAEIAGILEVPVGTVKSRIGRGIAQLRQIFLCDSLRVSSPGAENSAASGLERRAPARPVSSSCQQRADQGISPQLHRPGRKRDFSSTVVREPKNTLCVTNESPLCLLASAT